MEEEPRKHQEGSGKLEREGKETNSECVPEQVAPVGVPAAVLRKPRAQ